MRLKELRLKEQKTQSEVAKSVGLTQFTYCNYETGKTQPDIKTLLALANYFEVSLDYLCERPFNNNVGYIPNERKETITKLLSLNDNLFSKVSNIIDGIIIGAE